MEYQGEAAYPDTVVKAPVVFHPVPSSAANLITSSDDNADDEQEERKAKEALEVEETKSTIVSEDSVLSTEASQPTTTLAPTTRPTTTQPETTQTPSTQPPPKQPPSGQKTLKRHGYY